MATDDLKSFKIGDQVKQPVERPRPGQKKEPEGPPPSVGFPRIEAVVEQDQADLSGLESRQAALEEMAKTGGSNKEKAGAKKAAAAYQKTRELLSYLLETKEKLSGGGGAPPSGR
jgi:hypothetical protein